MRSFDRKALLRRMVEIDYRHKHRHLPGSLSALPIIADIYEAMEPEDIFILSKGHSCAALYAVLEAMGKHPNCALVHPERDVENGIEITSGSLGHGLPIAVGMAYANKLHDCRDMVHVLIGDGEAQEGSNFEALCLAAKLDLDRWLTVHMDFNGYQGSDALVTDAANILTTIFPIRLHVGRKGSGIKRFEDDPIKSVHLMTDADFSEVMEELA